MLGPQSEVADRSPPLPTPGQGSRVVGWCLARAPIRGDTSIWSCVRACVPTSTASCSVRGVRGCTRAIAAEPLSSAACGSTCSGPRAACIQCVRRGSAVRAQCACIAHAHAHAHVHVHVMCMHMHMRHLLGPQPPLCLHRHRRAWACGLVVRGRRPWRPCAHHGERALHLRRSGGERRSGGGAAEEQWGLRRDESRRASAVARARAGRGRPAQSCGTH